MLKKSRLILLRRIFILLIFICLSPLYAADWASIIKETGPGVAIISLTNSNGAIMSQGSAFVLTLPDDSQILVTNAHVVKEARYNSSISITAQFLYKDEDGENVYTAEIDKMDPYLDIAILRMEKKAPVSLTMSQRDKEDLMSEILVLGYPLGRNFKATPGYIQAYQEIEGLGEMIDMSSVLAPGNSGGPVLDSQGNVAGIATAAIPGYNFNLALPIKNLLYLSGGEDLKTGISIESDPDGARVFLDGHYKGDTPLSTEVYNKEYKVLLEKEGFESVEALMGPWAISEDKEIHYVLDAESNEDPVIYITTEPEGAKVSINNRYMGETPLSIQMAEDRLLRIKITKKRYDDYSETYRVKAEAEQYIEIKLKK